MCVCVFVHEQPWEKSKPITQGSFLKCKHTTKDHQVLRDYTAAPKKKTKRAKQENLEETKFQKQKRRFKKKSYYYKERSKKITMGSYEKRNREEET